MDWEVPTFLDVLEARRRIARYLRPTALFSYPALNDVLRAEVFVKHENHQPIGAFKIRGGVNLISQLGTNERARGVIAASTGNHGQPSPTPRGCSACRPRSASRRTRIP